MITMIAVTIKATKKIITKARPTSMTIPPTLMMMLLPKVKIAVTGI